MPLLRHLLRSAPAVTALLGLGLLVWLMLPAIVVTLDDDFWYLRSVLKTLWKGRPWTDDWLTPWAASASALSAVIFQITGSFTAAIHLPLALSAGLAAMGFSLFLKEQGQGPVLSMAVPLLVLTAPMVLFMFLMYTGVALYMACLWWCLLLAERKQWLLFLLPWALAAASRQSAIAWLALPGWAFLQELRLLRGGPGWTRRPALLLAVFTAAAAWLLMLKLTMNPTAGQKLALGGFGGNILSLQTGIPLLLGALAWLAGLGIAGMARLPQVAACAQNPPWRPKLLRLLLTATLAAAGAWGGRQFRGMTLNTHDCYPDPFSALLFPAAGVLLGAAAGLAGGRPRADASLAALGSVLLVAFYGGRFDYYFNDALFFGIAAGFPLRASLRNPSAVPPPGNSCSAPPGPDLRQTERRRTRSRVLAAGVMVTVTAGITAFWHLRGIARLTAQQEHAAAQILLYENAFRSGKLEPARTGMATFGYLGWLFQDYYAAHEGRENPVLGGFTRYAQNWDGSRGTGVITTFPKSLSFLRGIIPTHNTASLRQAADTVTAGELRAPLLGGHQVRYVLKRSRSPDPVPGSLRLDASSYQRIPFPVNDAEWRSLIRNPPPMP